MLGTVWMEMAAKEDAAIVVCLINFKLSKSNVFS